MTDTKLTDEAGRNSLDPKHAPVSIPAGSFDIEELQKHLDKAVEAEPEKRDEMIGQALEAAAAEGTNLTPRDPASIDGYRFVEIENEELGITERTQVFDEAAAAEAAGDHARPKRPAITRGRSGRRSRAGQAGGDHARAKRAAAQSTEKVTGQKAVDPETAPAARQTSPATAVGTAE